jgi:hypothetical protein
VAFVRSQRARRRERPADTLDNFRKRLGALEQHTGVKPPVPEKLKPLPPPMGYLHGRPTPPRTTQLVSTRESRAISDRRAAARAAAAVHARTTRFFSGPVEPANARIPRASPTGQVI